MHILEICDDYPPLTTGGIGAVVFELAKEWSKMNLDVHVLCCGSDRDTSTESEGELTVTRIPLPRFPPRNLWFQIKGLRLLQKYLHEADIVHSHGGSSAIVALANRQPKRPWIVTVHGLYNRMLPLYLLRPIKGRALREDFVYTFGFPYLEGNLRTEQRFADHLVFVSKHTLEDARVSYGINLANKSSAIWAPVSEKAFLQCPRRSGQDFVFGFVGRFFWSKGLMLLVDAFSRLTKTTQNVVLRLYGSGPLETTIRKRVKRLQLDDVVELKGWGEHTRLLSELSTDVDAVVHPSLYEACPISVLEAMSMGKPTIVADLPWSREFVRDQVTGLRSKPDVHCLYKQMDRLVRDDGLRGRLARNAEIFAKLNFHPAKIAQAYLDQFNTILHA